MARIGGIRGRKAPVAALALVLALGLAAGLAFDRTELRGVTVAPAPPALADAAAKTTVPVAEPADFATAFEAGLQHLRSGDAHSAARAFEAARRANPHSAEAQINLGFAYLELDQPAAARTVFDRATAIAPTQTNGYYGLAEALEALGDIEGAMGAMRTYLHLTGEDDPFRRRALAALWEWETREVPATAEATAPAATSQDTGVPILDAPLQTLGGAPASLAAHRGKFVVLNVWAVWCAPCRAELPSLDRLAASLDPQRFTVLGVSIDRERAFIGEFLAELGVAFPSYWDGARRLTGELLGANKIPLTVIIDPEGRAVVAYEGARDWSTPDMVAAIRGLAEDTAPLQERVAEILRVLR